MAGILWVVVVMGVLNALGHGLSAIPSAFHAVNLIRADPAGEEVVKKSGSNPVGDAGTVVVKRRTAGKW